MKTSLFLATFALVLASSLSAHAKSGNQHKFCRMDVDNGQDVLIVAFPAILYDGPVEFDPLRLDVGAGYDQKSYDMEKEVKFTITSPEKTVREESTVPRNSCEPDTYLIESIVGLDIELPTGQKITGKFTCIEDGYGPFDSSEDCEARLARETRAARKAKR